MVTSWFDEEPVVEISSPPTRRRLRVILFVSGIAWLIIVAPAVWKLLSLGFWDRAIVILSLAAAVGFTSIPYNTAAELLRRRRKQ